MTRLTLTTDSDARKRIPLIGGLWGYFAAALVGVAQHSFKSNEKHNKDAPLHWSIDNSTDHAECIGRHLLDLQELIALYENGGYTPGETATEEVVTSIIDEANALGWRALAFSQTLHMRLRGAPMPFNARLTQDGPPARRDYLGEPIAVPGPLTASEIMALAATIPEPAQTEPSEVYAVAKETSDRLRREAEAADLAGYPGSLRHADGSPADESMTKFDGLYDGDEFMWHGLKRYVAGGQVFDGGSDTNPHFRGEWRGKVDDPCYRYHTADDEFRYTKKVPR